MSSNTQISALPYPALVDAPNVPQDITNLAQALDHLVIPKYATATAQTAANPAPADGDAWYRQDLSQGFIQRGSSNYVLGDSYSKIYEKSLTASGTFAIPSIPQYFKHLKIVLLGVGDDTSAGGNGFNDIGLQFNGVTTNAYSYHFSYTVNGGAWSNAAGNVVSSIHAGFVPTQTGDPTASAGVGASTIMIYNYASSMTKPLTFDSHASSGVGPPNNIQYGVGGGEWGNNPPAITSILVQVLRPTNTFTQGSYCVAYGIG